MNLIKTVMKIGQRVRIIEGATPWMQKRGLWSGVEVESIDGMFGTIYGNRRGCVARGGDLAHYVVKVDGVDVEIAINPQWLVKV